MRLLNNSTFSCFSINLFFYHYINFIKLKVLFSQKMYASHLDLYFLKTFASKTMHLCHLIYYQLNQEPLIFWLFKDKCISLLVRTKYIGQKFNIQLFFLPTVSYLFSPGPPRATSLLEISCLEKITVCVIETMLVTLPLVQMNKAWREVNQTNHVHTKINIMKGLHLIPGSTCHWISNQMRYFFKNIFWSKHFPATTNCRSWHSRVFLVKPVLKIS